MIDKELLSRGYQLHPTRYSPHLGFARVSAVIGLKPAQRYFDVKRIHIPTFDGRFVHQTTISRHELDPQERFQVGLGKWSLEDYQGNKINGFSFGGVLEAAVEGENLHCDFTSNAPIFKLTDDLVSESNLLFDEITLMMAEKEARLAHHEDELFARLARFEPYAVFLSCLVSLQKRLEGVPSSLRKEKYRKTAALLQKVFKTVRTTDGWDGCSPTLDELLTPGS